MMTVGALLAFGQRQGRQHSAPARVTLTCPGAMLVLPAEAVAFVRAMDAGKVDENEVFARVDLERDGFG